MNDAELLDQVLLALQSLDRSVANLAGNIQTINERLCALELAKLSADVAKDGASS